MRKPFEYYPTRQGRPYAVPTKDLESGESSSASLGEYLLMAIYFRDFDGGIISEPTEFNNWLDKPFDGGNI